MIRNDNVRTEYSKLGVRMTVTIVSRWLLRVTRVYFRVVLLCNSQGAIESWWWWWSVLCCVAGQYAAHTRASGVYRVCEAESP
jgi:hypothetical protein